MLNNQNMDEYYNIEIYDINNNLTEKEKNILKKLGIAISNKKYTQYEYEILKCKVMLCGENIKNSEVNKVNFLLEKQINIDDYYDVLTHIEEMSN